MASTYIICNDNIGLTFNSNSSQMTFYIPTINTKDDNKFVKACLEKINEMYNPKEPYFFCSKDIIKNISLQNKTIRDNTIFIDFWANFTSRIYKIKIKNIIEEPIYILCSSSDLFNNVVSLIKKKYKNVSNGIFKYNNNILDVNTPLDKCNFTTGNFAYNEIIFEPIEKTKVVKTKVTKEVKNDISVDKKEKNMENKKEDNDENKKEKVKTQIKKSKEKIPLPVKHALWAKYFSDNMNGICQCCKTTPIHSTNFDCGHIISEKCGGNIHLDNLKPICRTCNSSMGTQNMEEYMKKYGFDKL